MSIRKRALYVAPGVVAVLIAATALFAHQTKSKIEETFALNQQRKAEGYYLAPFEFEALAAAYRLDHGDFLEGLAILDRLHGKLSTTKGLIKTPEMKTAREALDFYRRRQHPVTGAFYPNDTDPLFAYMGVTANMIGLIETLSVQAGEPFRLRYPLRFLEEIDTPETLRAFLDDVSTVGWIGARIKPPFVAAIELRDIVEQAERLGFHSFREDWKRAFHQWFIDNQDPDTGLWGPRRRGTGEIIDGGTPVESQKVIKLFVDAQGNDRHPDFPLPNKDRIFASLIDRLSPPMPDRLGADLHDWILIKDRGFRMLTRYLWKDASPDRRDAARRLIEEFVAVRFTRYFVEADGAFSLYPDADRADLDGTGEAIGMFDYVGALSIEIQHRLWGPPSETVDDLGRLETGRIGRDALAPVLDHAGVNSIRLYRADPGEAFLAAAAGIHYPRGHVVPDILDLLPKVKRWAETTDQRMGNWVTREAVLHRARHVDIRDVPVFGDHLIERANALLNENGELVAVGFDVLQVPRVKIAFKGSRD